MTARTTELRSGRQGLGTALAMSAASAVLVAAAAVGLTRMDGGTERMAAPAVNVSEGAAPRGGMAERYTEIEAARTEAGSATVTTMGGMAERYSEQQVAAARPVTRDAHMGGMAELYRDLEGNSAR